MLLLGAFSEGAGGMTQSRLDAGCRGSWFSAPEEVSHRYSTNKLLGFTTLVNIHRVSLSLEKVLC